MKLLYNFFVFLLVGQNIFLAQDVSINKEIKKIDSLITLKEFDIAKKKVNNFYKLIGEECHRYQCLEQKLMVRYLQGEIENRLYNQNKALQIFLEVMKEAEENNFYKIACRAKISVAVNYEKANNLDLAYKYLEEARKMCQKYHFFDQYSRLYVRYAQMHRYFGYEKKSEPSEERKRLEKLGLHASIDSSFYYVRKAIEFSKKYNNEIDANDAYVVLGHLYSKIGKDKLSESSACYLKTIPYWKKTNNFETIAIMYNNVASNYIKAEQYKQALRYGDSALAYYKNMFVYHKYRVSKLRARIYKELGVMDSAYHYLELAYEDREKSHHEAELSTTKNLEEKYQNEKKETIIKSKNQQILFIAILLTVITIATVLIFRRNRKINSQNKIISKQLGELTKILEQKQVLLSELQHRVKNNLQHVISILEIQKESVDFNNIDELIRGNQNRIHSMALLHKKLNLSDNANEVGLKRYVTELSELVKESYDNEKKTISVNINCEIETLSLEKALPIGLIIVELVSNSMKHAFKKRNIGIINIEITRNENTKTNQLYYADNGEGFDFNKTNEKGLGLEITKGLIDQLDGTIETKTENGFELTIYFN
ncbi:sensor histidine kinase [Cloacibacterium sp.]|uniref:sensor histidine kinase n=1 Tax=Cloacibacterium sp. TaxID=1913682 RepID=UPI0039E378C3